MGDCTIQRFLPIAMIPQPVPFLSSRKLLWAVASLLSLQCIVVSSFGVPFIVSSKKKTLCCRDPIRISTTLHQAKSKSVSSRENENDNDKDDMDEEEEGAADYDNDESDYVELPQGMEDTLTTEDLDGLTVDQMKQQLRLRGLKVSGRKSELMARLLSGRNTSPSVTPIIPETPTVAATATPGKKRPLTMAQVLAQAQEKELVDVTEYLDEEDKGKNVKAWKGNTVVDADFDKENANDDNTNNEKSDNKAETWGSEARIVDDYEGRNVVVDGLSRTLVEFKGSNQSYVSAFVVASRDALKPFLAGGRQESANVTAAEERLREIQTKREKDHRTHNRFQGPEGVDEGDPTGIYDNVLDRDYSDWGSYSVSGALMSATEVQGVLLLSDIYGAFNEDTQALAERIAFECQPIVVMVPDLFR
jgi:SAP domain